MTTLQHAIEQFESRARTIGCSISTESNGVQTILAGDHQTGLRLTWDSGDSRLIIAITHGADSCCTDWLDLYDMVVDNKKDLPVDHGISVTDAIEYGVELMTPHRRPNVSNRSGE